MVVMLLCGYVCMLVEILCFMVGWFEGMLCCWIEDWIEEVFVKNENFLDVFVLVIILKKI